MGVKVFRKSKGASWETFAEAKVAVRDFWGVSSSGGQDQLVLLEDRLNVCDLSADQLDRIRMELPAINRATVTGAKLLRADSLLKRLVAATGG